MSEFYKVGIEIAMSGNAAAGLDTIASKLIGIKGHADDLTEVSRFAPDFGNFHLL